MLDSVPEIRQHYARELLAAEWLFTIIFTLEYLLRIYVADNRAHYIGSFFGLVDLLAIIPSYISLFIPGTQYLLVIRTLRLLRVFRILKLVRYSGEALQLLQALRHSQPKITVFLGAVLSMVIIFGSLMYLIEGPASGFSSIPQSVYWAIVTVTTVGYGDIAPITPFGQFVSAILMILGYGVIAVPTGIVTAELTREAHSTARNCSSCNAALTPSANFCQQCGERV